MTIKILDPQPDLWQPGSTIRWDDLRESRLLEHPGHADQKAHGRRGGGGDRSAQLAALDGELRKVRGAERLVAIDPKTGAIKLDKGGAGTSVEVTLADDIAMRGSIASHNHPIGWNSPEGTLGRNGSGPSVDDLLTAQRAGVAEMRIVAPTQTFSVKPGTDDTWGKQTDLAEQASKLPANRIEQITMGADVRRMEIDSYNKLGQIENDVRIEFFDDIQNSGKTVAQAEAMHHEELLNRAAKEFGWEVTITRESTYVDPRFSTEPQPTISGPQPKFPTPGGGPSGPISGWAWDQTSGTWSASESVVEEIAQRVVRLMEHPGHGSEKVHGRKGTSGVDVSGTQMANISAKTKAKIAARAEALGVPSIDQQVKDITDRYNRASDATKAAGMEWYDDAHRQAELAGEVTGYGLEKSAATFAVMSPQHHWDSNRASALETMSVIKGDKPYKIDAAMGAKLRPPIKAGTYKPSDLNPSQVAYSHPNLKRAALSEKYFTRGVTDPKAYAGYGKQHEKVVAAGIEVLRGKDIDAAVGGVKVRNFYNNIYDPRSGGVTIDDWAYRAAIPDMHVSVRYHDNKTNTQQTYEGAAIDAPYGSVGGMIQSAPKVIGENYNAGLYPITAEAYTRAAKEIGIRPNQLQATVWVQIRDVDKGAR